jgi:hypothetical protein
MLDHLLDFEPPVVEATGKDVSGLDRATPDQILNAQVNTTKWLEKLGVEDDHKILQEAEAKAARTVFAALTNNTPPAETKNQLILLKTPESVRHLVTMLSAYDWEFVEQAKQMRGMAVAAANGCAGCHGAGFEGGAFPFSGVTPSNITPDPTNGVGAWTDAQIVAAPQGIGNRHRRGGRNRLVQRPDQARDQRRRDQRTRPVMDQHPRRAGSGQMDQRIAHGCIACRPAFDQLHLHRGGTGDVIGVNDHNHLIRESGKGPDAVPDNRLACQKLPLLWNGAAGPRAAPGRYDDCRDCHSASALPFSVLGEGRKPDNAAIFPYDLPKKRASASILPSRPCAVIVFGGCAGYVLRVAQGLSIWPFCWHPKLQRFALPPRFCWLRWPE